MIDLDRLAAAKLWLISTPATPGPDAPRDLPYLAHALYALVPVESPDVPRATVDEHWRVYINPTWLSAATVPDVARELAHLLLELLHAHRHLGRALRHGGRDQSEPQEGGSGNGGFHVCQHEQHPTAPGGQIVLVCPGS